MVLRTFFWSAVLLLVVLVLPATAAFAQGGGEGGGGGGNPPMFVVRGEGPDDTTVEAGTERVAVGDFSFARAGDTPFSFFSMTLQAFGSGDDAVDVSEVAIYWQGPNGLTRIASSLYPVDNGVVTLTFTPFELEELAPIRLSVRYSFSADTADGSTFEFQLIDTGISEDVPINGLPANSALITVTNAGGGGGGGGGGGNPVSLTIVDNSPADRTVDPGAKDETVASWDMQVSGGTVQVNSVTVRAAGTGNDASGITAVQLYEDVDRDGLPGAGDRLLDEQQYASDDGVLTLTTDARQPQPILIGDGQAAQFLVVYSLSVNVSDGDTFSVSLVALDTTTGNGDPPAILGLPAGSATLSITVPAGQLIFAAVNPADAEVNADEEWVVAGVEALATTADAIVETLTINARGTGRDDLDVLAATLVHDTDRDGSFGPGDVILDAQTFAADDGEIVFDCSALPAAPFVIASGTTARLLVVYRFASTLVPGETFSLTISSAVVTAPIVASGLPTDSATLTVALPTLGGAGSGGCSATGGSGTMWWLPMVLLALASLRRRA